MMLAAGTASEHRPDLTMKPSRPVEPKPKKVLAGIGWPFAYVVTVERLKTLTPSEYSTLPKWEQAHVLISWASLSGTHGLGRFRAVGKISSCDCRSSACLASRIASGAARKISAASLGRVEAAASE